MEIKPSIKPEIASTTLFIPKKDSSGIYCDDMRIELIIAIGSIKGKLILRNSKNYNSSSNDREVEIEIRGFDQIQSAIEIDIDDIKSEYVEKLPHFYQEQLQQKIQCRTLIWENSWIHTFLQTFLSFGYDAMSCKIPSCAEFVAGYSLNMNVIISYCDFYVNIKFDSNKLKYIIETKWELEINKELSYSSIGTLLKSFIKRVDSINDKRLNLSKKEKERRVIINETIERYSKLFGNCHHEEKTEFFQYPRQPRIEYKIDSYYISINPVIYKNRQITRKIKISDDKDSIYTLGSFSYLSESDVIKILDVLNNS